MDLISTDPDRPGVFAVGQQAYGIFSLGQLSTGVIAVGQVARGVIAVGQGAVGVVAIGQGAIGVLYAGGMMAVGGRGFGICLKVLPKITLERYERPRLPPLTELSAYESGEREQGWLLVELDSPELGRLSYSPEARAQLEVARREGHTHACVTVSSERRVVESEAGYREALERERLLLGHRLSTWREAPPRLKMEGPLTSIPGLFLRALGMVGLLVAWWFLAGQDVARLFL